MVEKEEQFLKVKLDGVTRKITHTGINLEGGLILYLEGGIKLLTPLPHSSFLKSLNDNSIQHAIDSGVVEVQELTYSRSHTSNKEH